MQITSQFFCMNILFYQPVNVWACSNLSKTGEQTFCWGSEGVWAPYSALNTLRLLKIACPVVTRPDVPLASASCPLL